MTKRLITVILAVVATLGIAAAPAQAKTSPLPGGSQLVQPLGWEWGIGVFPLHAVAPVVTAPLAGLCRTLVSRSVPGGTCRPARGPTSFSSGSQVGFSGSLPLG